MFSMEVINLIFIFVIFLVCQKFIIQISKNVKLVLVTKTTTNTKIYVRTKEEDFYACNVISLVFINGDYYLMVMHLLMHSVIIDIFAFLFGGIVMLFIIASKVVIAENKIIASEPEFNVSIITMDKIITKHESQIQFYQSPFN